MTRRQWLFSPAMLAAAGKRSQFGIAKDSFHFRPYRDSLEFLEYAGELGAAGIQAPLTSLDAAYIKRLRGRAESLGMYIELQGALPKDADLGALAAMLRSARELGARCVRVVNPGPRRYEAFGTLEDWKRAAAAAEVVLQRALPVIESHRVAVAIENHRDWRLAEFVTRMKRYAGEYLGCCLDAGNNLALLDSPADVVEQLLPYAITTHIKDIGVEERPGGFAMTEVPLGAGVVDLRQLLARIRQSERQPELLIEMITRDPTPVPCLTDAYWTTMPPVSAPELARVLRLVRAKPSRLPRISGLAPAEQRRVEEENVRKCLAYV